MAMKPKQYRLTVTKEDIKNGIRKKSTSCPVALALKRKFNTDYAAVSYFGIEAGQYRTVGHKRFRRTQQLTDFFEAFDSGKRVKPTTFTLTQV